MRLVRVTGLKQVSERINLSVSPRIQADRDSYFLKADNNSGLKVSEPVLPADCSFRQNYVSRHDLHVSHRIGQLFSAFKTADVIQSAAIAMRPRSAAMGTTE